MPAKAAKGGKKNRRGAKDPEQARQDAVAKALKRHETAADALYESVATSTADCLAGLPPLTARPLHIMDQRDPHAPKDVAAGAGPQGTGGQPQAGDGKENDRHQDTNNVHEAKPRDAEAVLADEESAADARAAAAAADGSGPAGAARVRGLWHAFLRGTDKAPGLLQACSLSFLAHAVFPAIARTNRRVSADH